MENMWNGDFMEWYDRAKEIMKSKGWSQARLAREIEESEVNVSRYFAGTRNQDSIRAACKIANALGVDLDHLILGKIPNYQPHTTAAPPQLTIDITPTLKKYADNHPISKEHYIPIRLVGGRVAAGAPAQVREDEIEGWVLIYADREWIPNDPEKYTCAKIDGYSMSPVLQPGDIVAIDHAERDPETLNGKMVAFRIDEGVTVKWLKYDKQRELVVGIPENKDELDYLVTLRGEEINNGIVGKIAWWWAKR